MSKKDDFLEFVKVISAAQEKAPMCVRCGIKIDLGTAYSKGKCNSCGIDFADMALIAWNLAECLKKVMDTYAWYVPGSSDLRCVQVSRAYLAKIKERKNEN